MDVVRNNVVHALAADNLDCIQLSSPPPYSLIDPLSAPNTDLEDELDALEAEIALAYTEAAPDPALDAEDQTLEEVPPAPTEDQPATGEINVQEEPEDHEAPPTNELPAVVNETPVINQILHTASPHVPVSLKRSMHGRRHSRALRRLQERRHQFLVPSADSSDTDSSTNSRRVRV